MRLLRLLLIVLAFAAAAAGTVAFAQPQSGIVRPTTEPRAASVALGAELYAGNCASCHGIDGSHRVLDSSQLVSGQVAVAVVDIEVDIAT